MMRSLAESFQRLWRPTTGSRPFQLTRYFTATSLVAFAILAAALYFLELSEQRFFEASQRDQGAYFATVQAELLRDHRDAGRANLVSVYETSHITLTHVFANALWESHFAPLVAQAQGVPADRCRRPASDGAAGAAAVPPSAPASAAQQAQQACVAQLREQVTALPGFAGLDAPVRSLMRRTTVFKIKVYDLRGLTVYSSELAQVGEDKSDNAGWRAAAAGRAASELVHRNRFSAFEGVVEDRDLIQSYVPVSVPGAGVAGVFEIYSDVTPLLQQLDAATLRAAEATTRNQANVQQAAERAQRGMAQASARLLLITAALLAAFYLALLYLVRNGQRIIDTEARAREQSALREQEWHRDKMATMAAMAANVSHEVGNPLAIISGLAQEIAQWRQPADIDPSLARMIVDQTSRIAAMTRRINDFATAGREEREAVDMNAFVKAVCEFLAFDRRFRGTPIDLQLQPGLPACHGVPDHLTEVLMGLLQTLEESCHAHCGAAPGHITVSTAARDQSVVVRIAGSCQSVDGPCQFPGTDARLESARRRVQGMGGWIEVSGAAIEIHLSACEDLPTTDMAGLGA